MHNGESTPPHRPIRSYVLRTGRKTVGQERAFEEFWPVWGLNSSTGMLDFQQLFGRKSNVVFEIGFGMGDSLLAMAMAEPERDFIGVEVHTPGVGRLLNLIHENDVLNLRVFAEDAVQVLKSCVPMGSLDRIQVYFPDPWHKKRHHKRRLINNEMCNLMLEKLQIGGIVHLATDWEDYALQMMEVLSANDRLLNLAGPGCYSPRPDFRPLTKFERRGERLGHGVWDLLFQRVA